MIYVTVQTFSFVSLITSTLGKLSKQEAGAGRAIWVSQFEPCSVTCGGGFQRTYPECWIAETQVNKTLCDPFARPPSEYRPCGLVPCSDSPRWQLGDWTSCSSKCGPGWRRRVARCVLYLAATKIRILEEGMCLNKNRPPDEVSTCHSGVPIPCPPFASPDVACFSPPCHTETGPGGTTGLLPSHITLTILFTSLVLLAH